MENQPDLFTSSSQPEQPTISPPSGRPERHPIVLWLLADISSHWIPMLHDYGYSFFKLGEEAIVDLDTFNIQGNKGKFMQNVLNRFRNDGYEFEVLEPEQVGPRLPELQKISDEWLRSKKMREKQFSIGYFDAKYLTSFSCAIVWGKTGKIVAFANSLLWPGGKELSVDLMRYLPECPNGEMDLLFLKLFQWGKEHGYKTFNLGMAPLATVGEVRQARLSERLAKVLFQYGEHWYNFRGLRESQKAADWLSLEWDRINRTRVAMELLLWACRPGLLWAGAGPISRCGLQRGSPTSPWPRRRISWAA